MATLVDFNPLDSDSGENKVTNVFKSNHSNKENTFLTIRSLSNVVFHFYNYNLVFFYQTDNKSKMFILVRIASSELLLTF